MAKRKLAYPRVKSVRNLVVGRGCLRTVVDDFDGARVTFMLSNATPVGEAVGAALGAQLEAAETITKPPGEPSVDAVRSAAEMLAKSTPEVVVAIGGGSVLDWARLAAATAAGALDLDAEAPAMGTPHTALPRFVLVPTTCATGAEGATVAVLLNGERKAPIVADGFLASHVYLDAQFLEPVAPQQTALFLCDAVSHAVEAAVSIVPNLAAKELAVSGLRLLRGGCVDEPDTYSRERLLLGAYHAGQAASHCSVGAAHAFAHTAAGYGVGHAHGNALALAPALARLDAVGKLDDLADAAGFDSPTALRAWVDALVASALSAAPTSPLGDALAAEDELEAFSERVRKDVCMRASPLRLSTEETVEFVREAAAVQS